MNIQTGLSSIPTSNLSRRPAVASKSFFTPEPSDSVTLSSSSLSASGFARAGMVGLAGTVPVLGALTNFCAGASAGFNDKQTVAGINGVGFLANLGGTVTLAAGLLAGNSTVSHVGLGLLAGSGVAAAIGSAYL